MRTIEQSIISILKKAHKDSDEILNLLTELDNLIYVPISINTGFANEKDKIEYDKRTLEMYDALKIAVEQEEDTLHPFAYHIYKRCDHINSIIENSKNVKRFNKVKVTPEILKYFVDNPE